MPTDLLKRVNWDLIYPPFRDKCFEMCAHLRENGDDFFAISGFRSRLEQAELHAQGRSKAGKKVTNARPGQSLHNYGLAVDWCLDADVARRGLQPDWRLPEYERLADAAELFGLESAYRWKSFREGPHVQVSGLSVSDLMKVFAAATKQGLGEHAAMKAVWAHLDEVYEW
jgi:peptidoglycan LD-endopeptidase CwlK